MAFLLWHTVGRAKTHNDKEGSHVLPGRFRPMADDDYAASVPSEQAASDRLGPLELRHGAGPLVRPDGGESYAGQGDEAQRADGPPATAGMVLRHPAQTGSQAPSAACRDLLCAPPRVGGELVAGHPIGPGHRRHDLGGTVCGAGRERGVSRVRHSRGLGDPTSGHQTRLATRVAPAVTAAPPRPPPGPGGHPCGPPGFVRSVAVSAGHTAGLASIFPDLYGGESFPHPGKRVLCRPPPAPPPRARLPMARARFHPGSSAVLLAAPL